MKLQILREIQSEFNSGQSSGSDAPAQRKLTGSEISITMFGIKHSAWLVLMVLFWLFGDYSFTRSFQGIVTV